MNYSRLKQNRFIIQRIFLGVHAWGKGIARLKNNKGCIEKDELCPGAMVSISEILRGN